MNIFGWGGQSVNELKKVIIAKENLITQLRDEKIEAQISESRAQSGFNAQKESDRAKAEIEIAYLNRQIEQLESDFEDRVSSAIEKAKKELHADNKSYRAQLKSEMGNEIDSLKKSVKTGEIEVAKFKGLYDGTLLVVKSLETQLKASNDLNKILVEAMPEVKANLNAGNQNVSVNAKS